MIIFPEKFVDRPDYGGFDRTENREDHVMRSQIREIQKANNESARSKLESLYGVRYTELVRLPYFNLISHHVIDPMHNLFLGTAKYMLKEFGRKIML